MKLRNMSNDITLNLYPRITPIEEMMSNANVAYIKGVEGAVKDSKPKYGKWNFGWIYCMSIQPRRMNLSVLMRMSIPSPMRKYARVEAEAGT